MKKKIIFVLICVMVSLFLLTGCVETLKQDAIDGNYENKAVTSNGGLAVTYGNYLYFVNGYAGVDADNTFGKVTKGAVARVELDENKAPKVDTIKIIVPKNVYSTDVNYGGICIYNDYIYYSTTNMEKDSEGEPKTAEMVIMRTKVDGTATEIIAEFSSHSVYYKVVNNSLLYYENSSIYRINLTDKKFEAVLVEENAGTTYFFTKSTADKNAMDNYIFYTYTDSETSKTSIRAASVEGNDLKTIMGSDLMGTDATYTITILDIIYNGDKLTVFYNITDNLINTPSAGIYSYTYDSTLVFDKNNLIRYTSNTTATAGFEYSDFNIVKGNVVAYASSTDSTTSTTTAKIDVFSLSGDFLFNAIYFSASITIYEISATETEAFMYYYQESSLYKIKLFDIVAGAVTATEANSVIYYSGAFSSSWIPAEIINNKLYFLSSTISDNIYYVDLDKVVDRDAESRTAKVLGKITDTDRISAL